MWNRAAIEESNSINQIDQSLLTDKLIIYNYGESIPYVYKYTVWKVKLEQITEEQNKSKDDGINHMFAAFAA